MKKMTRREFLSSIPPAIIGTAALTGALGAIPAISSCSSHHDSAKKSPNILLIMVDQMQTPPPGYLATEGVTQGLKEIFSFSPLSPGNEYTRFFPGLVRLRQHAVVLRTHYTASSACAPSRACIMTGSCSTGVDDTYGLFKSPEDVVWLDEKVPTLGDWFRAVGYTTHYFGKWHVSDPQPPLYLEPWGFSDWESSYPESHVGGAGNLGVYRDVGFADHVVAFLKQKRLERTDKPWLTVGSLVNPHDNGSWPILWQLPDGTGVVPWQDYPPPPGIPQQGELSIPQLQPDGRMLTVPLNPQGFPQDNYTLPPSFGEALTDKPRCQYDYSLKMGLALKSINEYNVNSGITDPNNYITVPYPFQLQGADATAWSLAYNQRYAYCHYLADIQISRMLTALDESGLADNTIVVFLSDHGEMAGAHGAMIQKWHNAYEESIRVPMVISSPLVNSDKWNMREIREPTSSMDLLPTLLALAGFDVNVARANMTATHGATVVKPLAGADLSSHVTGKNGGKVLGPDGVLRSGVFYYTNDTVTERGETETEGTDKYNQYQKFLENVEQVRSEGYSLASGSVRQPNRVRALCTGDWKLVHYVDPAGNEQEEWELYCLEKDPIEEVNLVDFATGEVRRDVSLPGLTYAEVYAKNEQMKRELARQEAALLGNSV